MFVQNKIEYGFGYLIKDFPEHMDDFYELHYIYKGSGELICGNFRYELKPDTLIISPPGESHRIEVKDQLAFHIIRIYRSGNDDSLLNKICRKCWCNKGFLLPKSRRYEFERLKVLSSIPGAEAEKSAWYGLISILGELLIFDTQADTIYSNDILTEAIRYMDHHLQSRMKIEELASFFLISPSRLSQIFKERTGISTMDYFLRLKIDAACYLLKSADYLNKEMADLFGFSDEFHFSKVFKKKTGVSPKTFRDLTGSLDSNIKQQSITDNIIPS